jgi:hypothetical protein
VWISQQAELPDKMGGQRKLSRKTTRGSPSRISHQEFLPPLLSVLGCNLVHLIVPLRSVVVTVPQLYTAVRSDLSFARRSGSTGCLGSRLTCFGAAAGPTDVQRKVSGYRNAADISR